MLPVLGRLSQIFMAQNHRDAFTLVLAFQDAFFDSLVAKRIVHMQGETDIIRMQDGEALM